MKRVTIAIDSFKGSLSSSEVARAFERGFSAEFPLCELRKVVVADGGEGMVVAMVESLGAEYVSIKVNDPLMRPIEARYGILQRERIAIIEMSAASGLPLLEVGERNPMRTTTYGTGEMILDALGRGCRKFLIGIGGSATNDAGVGMLQALGFRFLDEKGQLLEGGGEILSRIASIDESGVGRELLKAEFVVACDVDSPLCGPRGAACVFAPQKGADRQMVEALDCGLQNFARVVRQHNGVDISSLPGAGAAGGLGGGFVALLCARLERGVDMVLGAMRFDEIISGSNLVITGEGRMDRQTMMGKVPSGVLRAALKQQIPCIAIAGAVEWCEELEQSEFAAIVPIASESVPLSEAMRRDVAERNVEMTAREIARKIKQRGL